MGRLRAQRTAYCYGIESQVMALRGNECMRIVGEECQPCRNCLWLMPRTCILTHASSPMLPHPCFRAY